MSIDSFFTWTKTGISLPLLLLLLSACAAPQQIVSRQDLQSRYREAVKDAEKAEPDEISRALVAITPSNDDLLWDEGKSRVLVATWTSYDGYDDKVGQSTVLARDIWVTAVPELTDFCMGLKLRQQDIPLRLEQLLGLPPGAEKTKFVEFWADADDLFRPSPDPAISDHEAELDFPVSEGFVVVSEEHKAWFEDLKSKSYGENGYPWTRLGYTYDWGNPDGDETGLSEFIVGSGASIEVRSVSKTSEYCR